MNFYTDSEWVFMTSGAEGAGQPQRPVCSPCAPVLTQCATELFCVPVAFAFSGCRTSGCRRTARGPPGTAPCASRPRAWTLIRVAGPVGASVLSLPERCLVVWRGHGGLSISRGRDTWVFPGFGGYRRRKLLETLHPGFCANRDFASPE